MKHEPNADPRPVASGNTAFVDWLLIIGMGLFAGGAMYLAVLVRTTY
ncbi:MULTISPECIES: hypothetical protein [Ralstonia]|jgi:hypothetical protein|uniref:Uncharacterized protein n=1 Tax=Ralstonia mojiangensis TaxID=2953895 RepID=A0AAE3I548_9RALS|nr:MULTISPECIES: hypothetical protein [Ralstonia]MCO5413717.1 hypothetical protein [Ralstonia mojiangensis]MCT7298754.1 hypothetical protein [Ralstonia mojiangensis]MCT7311602.1 hypothetical protein [Ralstonia mojiangensis]MCT7317575.1 hypothetical protein [Ralstonia mojiangensis]MCT7328576.1 hypothetical protein [Ralstonia mojiangensis]